MMQVSGGGSEDSQEMEEQKGQDFCVATCVYIFILPMQNIPSL